jgi:hypothetical protein
MAVSPDYSKGRVVATWRGDHQRTTAGDIYNKAEEMIKELGIHPTAKLYDWASADFGTISVRNGSNWRPADKGQDRGHDTVNTLFKNDMLAIFKRGQNGKLAGELSSVDHETPKRKRKDDLADPLRFICVEVPWNWTVIRGAQPLDLDLEPRKMTQEEFDKAELARRRGEMGGFEAEERALNQEFEEINELLMG